MTMWPFTRKKPCPECQQLKAELKDVFMHLLEQGRAGDRAKMACAMLMIERIGYVQRETNATIERLNERNA